MTTATAARITISATTVDEAKVSAPRATTVVLRDAEGRDIELPHDVQETLLRTLIAIAEQGSVSIAQVPDELTSTVAADLLGVSRPTLIRWANEGVIDSFNVGSHKRFRKMDVEQLRDRRELERRSAFNELRELDAEEDFEFFDN